MYTYKFSTNKYHYYMRKDMVMVKVAHSVPGGRGDNVIDKYDIIADNDPEVMDYFS